jgi:hypothetical protein
MQKFPDSINTKIDNILCKNKVKEDILGTDSNLGISKLSKLISPINSQPLNLFRSTNITPTKVNTTSPTKSNKNPSYSKSKN